MKTVWLLLGCLMILIGLFCAAYINAYMLITGIINIYHGGSIVYNVFMILFREVLGVFACFICWVVGFGFFKASE